MKNIKVLRKTNNSTLLIISSDTDDLVKLQGEFQDAFKEIYTTSKGEEAIALIKTKKIDLAIVANKITDMNFKSVCFELNARTPAIPKIIISDNTDDATLIDAVNCGAFMVVAKPLDMISVKLSVIMCLNHTKRGDKLVFTEGVYYDEYREQFFKKDGTIIELTKLEIGLLKFLIDKKGEIVDYEAIQKYVWKGKKMSVFTMRNVVNKIRLKVYYDIIRNYSNKGYSIDTPKNG